MFSRSRYMSWLTASSSIHWLILATSLSVTLSRPMARPRSLFSLTIRSRLTVSSSLLRRFSSRAP